VHAPLLIGDAEWVAQLLKCMNDVTDISASPSLSPRDVIVVDRASYVILCRPINNNNGAECDDDN